MITDNLRKTSNIVVVDDDPKWQENLRWPLEGAGYNVTYFSSVDSALESMNTLRNADVIVTDGDTKSRFNGLDLLRRMKDEGPGLVLLSGDRQMVATAKEEGVAALKKIEFDPATLIQLVRQAQNASQQQRKVCGDDSFNR